MSAVDELLEPCHEGDDADYSSPGPQTLGSALKVSRDECSALFRFLQQTKEGEDFLQAHYEKVQEYKSGEHGRKARQKSNKVLKLTDARKYEQWEGLKSEFFFYYMQQNLPAVRIETAMKNAYPSFSNYSPRTMINRLENWGFTLCPRFRRVFIKDLREREKTWEQSADRFFDDEIFGVSPRLPHFGQTMPEEVTPDELQAQSTHNPLPPTTNPSTSYQFGDALCVSSLPVAAPVGQISTTVAPSSHLSNVHQDLMFNYSQHPQQNNMDFISGEDINEIPASDPAPNLDGLFEQWNFPDPVLDSMMYPSDAFSGTIVGSMIDQMHSAPGSTSKEGPDVMPDIDSGYHSMEVCDPASSGKMPGADQVQNNAKLLSYSESEFPLPLSTYLAVGSHDPLSSRIVATTSLVQSSPSGIENRHSHPSYPSILHRVPCGKNHWDIVLGLRRVCTCGLKRVHAFCLEEMGNFEDEKVLNFLSSINNMTECDGAGNTALHYAAAAGRRAIIEHILQSGADIQLHNSFGQNFLHVLDGTCFGGELIEFLSRFRNRGLLDQRDHSGRTILHGLLQHPIERVVCEQLVDFYGPQGSYQFALRDNQGRNAAEYLRVQFPNSFHNHANYVQTVLLFETFAETFVIKPTSSGQIHPQTASGDHHEIPEVLQIMQTSKEVTSVNRVDWTGSNALHCLAQWPSGRDPPDEACRLTHLKHAIHRGVDLNSYDRDGRTPLLAHLQGCGTTEDEYSIQPIVKLLVEGGADVHMRDRDGNTALYHAVSKGFNKCVSILLQHGAHVNFVGKDGRSLRRIAQESLPTHFHVSDDLVWGKLQQRLGILRAMVDYKAELEPTTLQRAGFGPSR